MRKVLFLILLSLVLFNFAVAQVDSTAIPEEGLGEAATFFGLDISQLAIVAGLLILLINTVKSQFGLTGKAIPWVALVLSFVYSGFKYYESPLLIIVGGAMIFMMAVGGWDGAKMIAHKMGVSK